MEIFFVHVTEAWSGSRGNVGCTARFPPRRERDVESLVAELRRFRLIVAANPSFDFRVLERYDPFVRRDLGFRTIDVLAHPRFAVLLALLQGGRGVPRAIGSNVRSSPWSLATSLHGRLGVGVTFVGCVRRGPDRMRCSCGLTIRSECRSQHWPGGLPECRNLRGRGGAPQLYRERRYSELWNYCKRDSVRKSAGRLRTTGSFIITFPTRRSVGCGEEQRYGLSRRDLPRLERRSDTTFALSGGLSLLGRFRRLFP